MNCPKAELRGILSIKMQSRLRRTLMRSFTAVIEKCPDTDLFVGFVPGFPGAHSQAETLEELHDNLKEVIEMLLEDGEPQKV